MVVPPGPGSWITVSGQVGVPYKAVPNAMEFADEVRVCFERIAETLGKAGATMAHVVKIQVFLTDLEPYGVFARIRSEFFPSKPPASTAVQVAGLLLNARIEIDAVAFLPEAV